MSLENGIASTTTSDRAAFRSPIYIFHLCFSRICIGVLLIKQYSVMHLLPLEYDLVPEEIPINK